MRGEGGREERGKVDAISRHSTFRNNDTMLPIGFNEGKEQGLKKGGVGNDRKESV